MALDPNIILQAGRVKDIDPGALFQQASSVKLGRLAALRGTQTQQALDRVRNNPDDPDAITQLAALDPAAGNAYLASQASKRAGETRSASADLIRSMPSIGEQPGAAPGTAPGQTAAQAHLAPTSPAMVATGQAVAGGMSPTEAAARVVQSGGADALNEVIKSWNGLDDVRKGKLQEGNAAAGQAALSLLNVPQAQRAAALQQLAPGLAQHYITPDKLGDLSDTTLHGIVGQATTVAEGIKQANSDRDYALDVRKQGETERHNQADENKPITAQFGSALVNPRTGAVVYGGDSGIAGGGDTSRLINSDAGGGQVPDSVQTLGQFVTFGKGLNAKGAKSSAAGTYQITGSTMAQFAPKALGSDWQSQPFNADSQEKVGQAIFDWAKSQPNPAAALRARWVSLSPAAAAQAVKGTWEQARGTIAAGESGGSSGGAGGMSADAIDLAAREGLAHGGVVPSGYARNKAAQAAITNRMAALAKGQDVGSIIQGGQTTKSQGAAFQQWNKPVATSGSGVVTSIGVAIDHLDQAQQAANALQNGNRPLLNKIANTWAKETGKPAVTNFTALKGFVTDEVVKGILGTAGGVHDRAQKILDDWQSPAQSAGVVNQLQGLMAAQLAGKRQQYQNTTGRDDFERYLEPRALSLLQQHNPKPRISGTLSAPSQHPSDIQAILQKYK